jgi:site-specific recombinase XerD
MAKIEAEADEGRTQKAMPDAVAAFHLQYREAANETRRKYTRILESFQKFAPVEEVSDITVGTIDDYKASRDVSGATWAKELQVLRQFLSMCHDRGWIAGNPARRVKMPRNLKPANVWPYTPEEVVQIIAACDQIGQDPYERRRARAMVLLMRYYALRRSDVAMLRRDAVRAGRITLDTFKNGKPIDFDLHPEVAAALDCVPLPQRSEQDCEYFFWTGRRTPESLFKGVSRTLAAVFKRAGVRDAHPHRFRHTLATEILVKGGSVEDAANILGNTPAIVRRHYAKWTPAVRQRTAEILRMVHGAGTFPVQVENRAAVC